MSPDNSQVTPAPPSLMKSLMAGFDAVSNHLGLILFSITLDILLWFGPRLRLMEFFQPVIERPVQLPEMQAGDVVDMIQTVMREFNLLSILRTFPVGVPSLMVSRTHLGLPMGAPMIWEIISLEVAAGLCLLLFLLGLAAGTLFFSVVAQATLSEKVNWRQILSQWPRAWVQVLILTIVWLFLLLVIVIPFSCLFSVFLLSGFGFEQVALIAALVFGGLLVWLLLPLLFSPHGIFVNQRVIWASIFDSIRLTRFTLPSTSLLFLTIFILSEGLDVLWNMPEDTSWFTLVGIMGHAFVATSLLAASFVYYRDADRWVQRLIQQAKLSIA